jgi:hypothetical protein
MAVGDGVEYPVAVHGLVLGLHLHAEDLSLRTAAFSHPANIHCKFVLGQNQIQKAKIDLHKLFLKNNTLRS